MNFIHRVQAVILMNTCGSIVFEKYYAGPSTPPSSQKLASRDVQRELEANIFEAVKNRRSSEYDIILVKDHNVLFTTREDLIFIIVGDIKENPMLLLRALNTLVDTLCEFQDFQYLDSRQIEEKYELLVLTVDEMIDDGILLELRSTVIAESVEEVNVSTAEIPGRELLTHLNKMIRDNL